MSMCSNNNTSALYMVYEQKNISPLPPSMLGWANEEKLEILCVGILCVSIWMSVFLYVYVCVCVRCAYLCVSVGKLGEIGSAYNMDGETGRLITLPD